MGTLLEQVRKSVGLPRCELSDAELVQRFAVNRDEAAFAALVGRFGPMVLGVCRRVLRDSHAAEDAFQATFLVLARKAGSLVRQELVGNWLWGAAYRTARRAKADAARWRGDQREVQTRTAPAPVEEVMWRELQPVLDEEIYRLPAKYRQPFVLCYLQGKTNKEAAQTLGCPPGTVFTRLARGREILRSRLTRRGITLSSAALALAITQEARARVATNLASSTIKAATLFAAGNMAAGLTASSHALTLANGTLKAMSVSKWVALTVVLGTVTTLGSAGVLYTQHERADTPNAQYADALSLAIIREAPPAATRLKQESESSKPADAEKPKGESAKIDSVQEGKSFGFGRGFGMARDSATATVTFNSDDKSDHAIVKVAGSSKLLLLTLTAVQRKLALSDQQHKQVRELQKKQERALQSVAPGEPTDVRDAAEILGEVRRTAENAKKLIKEIDQAIDQLLSDKQRQQLSEMTLRPPHTHMP
jgi:RNA polymerase sigma factor (sigma-70 family)